MHNHDLRLSTATPILAALLSGKNVYCVDKDDMIGQALEIADILIARAMRP